MPIANNGYICIVITGITIFEVNYFYVWTFYNKLVFYNK